MKSVGPLEPAWSSTFQQPRTETLQKHTSCVTEQLPVGLSELWKDVESVANGELGGKGWRRCTAPESHPESVQAGQHRCIFLSFSAGWVSFWREISIISCTAEVEAELSFLEQEILEKFRNQASVGIGRQQLS